MRFLVQLASLVALVVVLIAGAVPAMACAFCDFPLFQVVDVADNDVLNIRQAPSAASPIVGIIPPYADDVVGLEKTGMPDPTNAKWMPVMHDDGIGFVAGRYLAFTGGLVGQQGLPKDLVNNPDLPPQSLWFLVDVPVWDTLNVRTAPGVGHAIQAQLPSNTVVAHAGPQALVGASLWIKIHYQGRTGWVNRKFLLDYFGD